VTFEAGVFEYMCTVTPTAAAAVIIRRLMAHLQLSYDEVGRMIGATGETVRRWEQGRHAPPLDKQSSLTAADAALSRLLRLIKADALPAVIRRPAEIFENDRALDWILRGRIVDVADRYERELRYQR
jgi:DNA-binding transcriptional regulator YiaG